MKIGARLLRRLEMERTKASTIAISSPLICDLPICRDAFCMSSSKFERVTLPHVYRRRGSAAVAASISCEPPPIYSLTLMTTLPFARPVST